MKKTNKNLKNLLLGCATFAMCCGVAGGVSMWTASADPITPTSNNFYCEGASIKITDNVDEARIRFHMTMTDELYNTYFTNGAANEGIETGMLVVPYDVYLGLNAEALDLSLVEAGAPVQNVNTTALWKDHSKDSTKQESIAYLQAGQIPEESHNRLLYFVGYVTDGTASGTYYTNTRKISMSQVAMYAQEDETISAYHDTLKSTYMHMHTITYKDAYERKAEIQFGESVLENTAYIANANLNGGLYWDKDCTDPVLSTDYVTGDMNVYVKNPNKAELLSFDYASDADKIENVKNVEWLDSYKGEIGVMKGSYTEGIRWTPQVALHPMQDLANESIYTDYTHVGVRLYIVQSETVDSIWTYVRCNADTKNIVKAVYNQWADYLFPIEDLREYSGTNWMKFIGDATTSYGTVGEFYVADIFLVNQATVTVTGKQKIGETLTFTLTGAEGEVDLSAADISVVLPNGNIEKGVNGQYVPTARGKQTVYVKANGYYAVTTIKVTGVVAENELLSFDFESDMSYVTGGGTRVHSWVPSFAEETGVMKIEYTTDGNWQMQFTFTPLQDITDATSSIYTNYTTVVLKMYIVQDETYQSNWQYVFMNNATTNRSSVKVQTNTWVEYTFDISTLNLLENGKIKFGGKEVSTPTVDETTGETPVQYGCFYVADIYLK